MKSIISIRPSKDLRNSYAQISALCRENPVAITVNGREDIVVLSHEDYVEQQNHIAELETRLALYSELAQAADDVKLGRLCSLDEAADYVHAQLENMDL